jgi:hypothetical protein
VRPLDSSCHRQEEYGCRYCKKGQRRTLHGHDGHSDNCAKGDKGKDCFDDSHFFVWLRPAEMAKRWGNHDSPRAEFKRKVQIFLHAPGIHRNRRAGEAWFPPVLSRCHPQALASLVIHGTGHGSGHGSGINGHRIGNAWPPVDGSGHIPPAIPAHLGQCLAIGRHDPTLPRKTQLDCISSLTANANQVRLSLSRQLGG